MILVLKEFDHQDKERLIIGVASCRGSALEMIIEYYGKDACFDNLQDIRDSNIDFTISIKVDGCRYTVTAMDFEIDVL